ncbi:hypothetical protein [Verminephrobacter aporrectodeae]|uniref:Uncharacterized protein n=1 Tax=Verminephrobacter aporrectodeae subsp. tuberculatae TaxID=1110392 RepID=A0ABT3KVH4_9BURK|nr:hypothetical protein [Verminephrobacter aporrectodeae]MCW5322336.1 hypothetical protein [Verminephrobacter aporrectodeae subsp. tuberculatae]MCW8177111.1 hypothetical protein [Verminephrobacter aporrectodeae subsp. tuberculatae]MCW8202716.1 hypothetical protein [Verminephrobacter aporrectodeae subsp. tuberculatae]
MAAWFTVLKLVPWGQVIEATPQVLQAARKLLRNRRAGNTAQSTALVQGADGQPALPTDMQLQQLRERVRCLEQEQQDCAALIESLAEQTAQVVRAVETLRLRARRLTGAVLVLGAACLGLLVWGLLRQQ